MGHHRAAGRLGVVPANRLVNVFVDPQVLRRKRGRIGPGCRRIGAIAEHLRHDVHVLQDADHATVSRGTQQHRVKGQVYQEPLPQWFAQVRARRNVKRLGHSAQSLPPLLEFLQLDTTDPPRRPRGGVALQEHPQLDQVHEILTIRSFDERAPMGHVDDQAFTPQLTDRLPYRYVTDADFPGQCGGRQSHAGG